MGSRHGQQLSKLLAAALGAGGGLLTTNQQFLILLTLRAMVLIDWHVFSALVGRVSFRNKRFDESFL